MLQYENLDRLNVNNIKISVDLQRCYMKMSNVAYYNIFEQIGTIHVTGAAL